MCFSYNCCCCCCYCIKRVLLLVLWMLLLMVWFGCLLLLLLLTSPLTVDHFGVLAVGLHRVDVTLRFVRRTLLSEHQVLKNRRKNYCDYQRIYILK